MLKLIGIEWSHCSNRETTLRLFCKHAIQFNWLEHCVFSVCLLFDMPILAFSSSSWLRCWRVVSTCYRTGPLNKLHLLSSTYHLIRSTISLLLHKVDCLIRKFVWLLAWLIDQSIDLNLFIIFPNIFFLSFFIFYAATVDTTGYPKIGNNC